LLHLYLTRIVALCFQIVFRTLLVKDDNNATVIKKEIGATI